MSMRSKRPRIFYGWWVAGATFVIGLYAAGVLYYGFTAMFEPIADEFGWSYTQISLAASLRGLEMSLLAPLAGLLVDRVGPRKVIFGGGIITTVGMLMLSQVNSLPMFYVSFFIIATGLSATAMTVLTAAVVYWFKRRIGTVIGIVNSGFGLGGLMVPIMVKLIDVYQWRMALIILAIGMAAVVLPLSLFVRHKPEHYGYLPDGVTESELNIKKDLNTIEVDPVNVSVGDALKSSAFWLVGLSSMAHAMMTSTVVTHVMPYLSSISVIRATAGLVASAVPLMSIAGRLSMGWLGDKVERRYVAAGAFVLMGVGLLCFGSISNFGTWVLLPFLVLFGIGYGGSGVLRAAMGSDLFGRANYGTIFGFLISMTWVGGMIGPPLAGWAFDKWNSYGGIWYIYASFSIFALVCVLLVRPLRSVIQASKDD